MPVRYETSARIQDAEERRWLALIDEFRRRERPLTRSMQRLRYAQQRREFPGDVGRAGNSLSDPTRTSNCYRLSRHAARYNGDRRTSSTVLLDMPMSVSSRSSSSRSCLYWRRRSHSSPIPTSHDNGLFQDHLETRKDGDLASRVLVELPQGMFHLRIGAKQRLAAEAHRAVVKGPSNSCITSLSGSQAIVSGRQLMKSPALFRALPSRGNAQSAS